MCQTYRQTEKVQYRNSFAVKYIQTRLRVQFCRTVYPVFFVRSGSSSSEESDPDPVHTKSLIQISTLDLDSRILNQNPARMCSNQRKMHYTLQTLQPISDISNIIKKYGKYDLSGLIRFFLEGRIRLISSRIRSPLSRMHSIHISGQLRT